MHNHLFSLAEKTAVIVGGGGVLPGAISMGFAEAGANLVIVDRNGEAARARASAICGLGAKAVAVEADAACKADLEKALEATLANFGQVNILVNAAGINSGTPFFEITEEEWYRILDVNLKGVFLGCQVFGKPMVDAGRGGSIINISSVASGPPLSKVFTYAISKAGIDQITQFLAREFAPYKIRVNAIRPGFFPAEQNRKLLTPERTAKIMSHTPVNRFGDPSELVGTAIYLASEKASSFTTGALLRVDGGFLATTI